MSWRCSRTSTAAVNLPPPAHGWVSTQVTPHPSRCTSSNKRVTGKHLKVWSAGRMLAPASRSRCDFLCLLRTQLQHGRMPGLLLTPHLSRYSTGCDMGHTESL